MLEKLSVPVFWGTVTYREYQNMEYKYTEEEAKAHLNQKLMDFLAELDEKGVQIIEKNVRINKDGHEWVLNADFLVQQLVGVSAQTERTDTGEKDTGEADTDE